MSHQPISGIICPKRKHLFATLRKQASEKRKRSGNSQPQDNSKALNKDHSCSAILPNERSLSTELKDDHTDYPSNQETKPRRKRRKVKRKYSGIMSKEGFKLFMEPDKNGCLGDCCYDSIDSCEHNAPHK